MSVMRLAGLAVVLLAAVASGATAAPLLQEIEGLQRELAQLRQELSDPSRAAAVLPSGSGADAQVRIQDLEGRLAALAGRVELMDHTVRQLEGRVERLASDAEMRLSGGAGAPAGTAAGTAGTGAAAPAGGQLGTLTQRDLDQAAGRPQTAAVPPPAADPAAAYDAAFDLLKRKDYAAADRAFAGFVAAYPKHPLAGNALYWQGETYYARSDFSQAAIVFADAYRRYPDGAKAPDIVLKLGLSLAQLGKGSEACQALVGLAKRFPNANPNLLRRAEVERSRLKCG